MFIGDVLKKRMNVLGISISELAEKIFMDEQKIDDIIQNRTPYEEIDEFDMELISNALHCEPQYFVDSEVRKNDLVIPTRRNIDFIDSNKEKARIQDFLKGFGFI